MRTTVSIADELLVAAKRRAAATGRSLGQVIEAALRRELAAVQSRAEPPVVPVFTAGSGVAPGLDMTSNRALHKALDEGHDLVELR